MTKLIALSLLAFSVTAEAGHRPNIRTLSCARAVDLVQSKGYVEFATSRYTFEGVYATGNECERGQWAFPTWLATSDSDACFVGFHCREGEGGRN